MLKKGDRVRIVREDSSFLKDGKRIWRKGTLTKIYSEHVVIDLDEPFRYSFGEGLVIFSKDDVRKIPLLEERIEEALKG